MARDIESEIRKALDGKAHEVDVPVDLASRTLAAARESAQPSLRDRLRALTDAWRFRLPVTGYPRWLYAGAAAATAVLLFFVGTLVGTGPLMLDEPVTRPLLGGGEVTEDSSVAAEPQSAGSEPDAARSGGAGTEPSTQIAPVPPDFPVPQQPGAFPPKIVRTANVEMEVESFDRAWDRAAALASTHGGFVTASEASLERGTVTMRIPAANLDAALDDIRDLGRLVRMSTTSQDVSAQIVDIDARLRVLEAEELQLLELLRRASGVGETLEVRDRLNSVRQEIESLEAQKEYFTNQVEYSTVNATFYEPGAEDPGEEDGVLIEAWRTALRVGLTIVAGALVVLGGLLPLAALGLGVWAAARFARRRRA